MIQKLKLFEQTVVFLRWATDAQFGKIVYVGEDFIEFLVLNQETMEYDDKILINSQLILEVVLSGYEVAKLKIAPDSNKSFVQHREGSWHWG